VTSNDPGFASASDRESPTSSLIIATYNWPGALAVVLRSVCAQRVLPTEVLIADDGSNADTARVVDQASRELTVPMRHIWHPDSGFRLGTIRNKAIAAARGQYILQLDGDMVLHPEFVASHIRFARRGSYVQGSRAMLDDRRTQAVLTSGVVRLGPFSRGVRNRVNALHAPFLAPIVRGPTDPIRRTRGCNMAFWRDDLIRVNGYDEAIEGWGREDSELAARLQNAGIHRRNLKFSAVAWHLHHATRSQDSVARNHAVFERTVREGRTRCAQGLDQWLTGAGVAEPPRG